MNPPRLLYCLTANGSILLGTPDHIPSLAWGDIVAVSPTWGELVAYAGGAQ